MAYKRHKNEVIRQRFKKEQGHEAIVYLVLIIVVALGAAQSL